MHLTLNNGVTPRNGINVNSIKLECIKSLLKLKRSDAKSRYLAGFLSVSYYF